MGAESLVFLAFHFFGYLHERLNPRIQAVLIESAEAKEKAVVVPPSCTIRVEQRQVESARCRNISNVAALWMRNQ